MKLFMRLLITGILAGVVLGILLKSVELLTEKHVYTLLLNVDYIPWLSNSPMSEVQEFALHIIVSVCIVSALYFVLRRARAPISLFVLGAVIIGGLYFPLTMLSHRTPDVTDAGALVYWLLAHAGYGFAAAIMIFSGKTGD
ncbi:hypothetical protein SAMN05216238_10320 [Lentibacillus persicus]|uniref:Uncharacterized protein n=1 Tax=Lentibacillus persicus TaxID=640948 RepID=A0A1I1U845_9BACI|nr:hypothetical protein [Lentibacillus persicus]SFD65748.1 hypothetical protein SAMN05216238_10320 [Lentibacillus persicus]